MELVDVKGIVIKDFGYIDHRYITEFRNENTHHLYLYLYKDHNSLYESYNNSVVICNDNFAEISLPKHYIPISFIHDYIIVENRNWNIKRKSFRYQDKAINIINYSGELILKNNIEGNITTIDFNSYEIVNKYLIKFTVIMNERGNKESVTYDLRQKKIIDPFNVISRIANERPSTNQQCYVATMVYGDINHPKVNLLRLFRDQMLVNYGLGRRFISFYYKYSQDWVEKLKDKRMINAVIKTILDMVVSFILLFLSDENENKEKHV